jgi:hypothetical protein
MTYEATIEYLTQNRSAVISQADSGDPVAMRIIQMHRMHVASPGDPGAIGVLMAATEEFKRREQADKPE